METTFSRVLVLAPTIARQSEQIERTRQLPAPLLADLAEVGCLRMLAPTARGGDELALPEILRVIELLGRADGATAWVVSQIVSAQLIFSYFSAEALAEFYAEGPDMIAAGAVAPKGRATPVAGGWRVTGRWPFVSGIRHASWAYVQCVVVADRRLRTLPNGMPELRVLAFPSNEVEVIDTWQASGLCGTGSHDIRLSQAFCPAHRSTTLLGGHPYESGASHRTSPLDQGGFFIAAVAVGIAQGALDTVAAMAREKQSVFSRSRLSASPLFQDRLGEAHLQLLAARTLLFGQAQAAWAAASAGEALSLVERATLRATVPTVIAAAAQVVDVAYTLGGGSAVYSSSPLQRHLRDVRATTQHAYAGRHHFGMVGALLAGEEIDRSLFDHGG